MFSAPDSKVHGANMGSIWGRQGPGGPHVGPMKFSIWALFYREVGNNTHLSWPLTPQFTDAYMRHSGSMNQNIFTKHHDVTIEKAPLSNY